MGRKGLGCSVQWDGGLGLSTGISAPSEPRVLCPAGMMEMLLWGSELGVTLWSQCFLALPTHLPAVLHDVQLPPCLPALGVPMHLVMNLGNWFNPSCSLAMRDPTQPWLYCQAQSWGNVPFAVSLPTL